MTQASMLKQMMFFIVSAPGKKHKSALGHPERTRTTG
jgi:hypothetical protein